MLPTVAHPPQFHPHRHLDHQLTYNTTNSPYGVGGDAAWQAALLRNNDPNKTAYQNVPRTRLQYPHPVQRLDAHSVVNSNQPRPTNTGEHTLRRKTPNGTLAAGYDGTPGDRAVQPPASKHILVSSLEAGQTLSPQTGLPLDTWQQPVVDQSSTSQSLNFPPTYNKHDSSGNNGLPGDSLQGGNNGPSWVREIGRAHV